MSEMDQPATLALTGGAVADSPVPAPPPINGCD